MTNVISIDSVFCSSASCPLSFTGALLQYEKNQSFLNKFYVNSRGNLYRVEAVLICPYDNIKKWIFVNHYFKSLRRGQKISFDEQNEFDVVLLISENLGDRLRYS